MRIKSYFSSLMICHGLLTPLPLSRDATCASLFLRQLERFDLNQRVLIQFYRSVIESVLSFGISAWFWGRFVQYTDQLERIVRHAPCRPIVATCEYVR